MIATKRKHKTVRRHKLPRGVDLAITYAGVLDRDRDRAIYKIVGAYSTGSGFSFLADGKRDITATVPEDDLSRVVGALKKIPGIEVKKRIVEWVSV